MYLQKTKSNGTASQIEQIELKIQNLKKEKEKIENSQKNHSTITAIKVNDLEKLDINEELAKLKEIQKERLLEDLSLILNDKIRELEEKEKSEYQKEKVLNKLTQALAEKINQLEIVNKQLLEEKKHSEELNSTLQATIKKLTNAEKELKLERDWLADQVEKKSLEVLSVIDELIKKENNSK